MVEGERVFTLSSAAKWAGMNRRTLHRRIREREKELGAPIMTTSKGEKAHYRITETALRVLITEAPAVTLVTVAAELRSLRADVDHLKKTLRAILGVDSKK